MLPLDIVVGCKKSLLADRERSLLEISTSPGDTATLNPLKVIKRDLRKPEAIREPGFAVREAWKSLNP